MPDFVSTPKLILTDISRLPPGLTNYWPMVAEGTPVLDIIGSDSGTIHGTVAKDGTGPAGGLRFGGADTDYVSLASCPLASCSANSTIAFLGMIRDTTVSPDGAGTNPTFINLSDGTNAIVLQHAFNVPGTINWAMGAPGTSPSGTRTSAVQLISNIWTHILITWNGTSNIFYINGISVAVIGGGNIAIGTTNNFSSRTAGVRPINGSMAQVMMWPRILTAYEAMQVYTMTLMPPVETQAAWVFVSPPSAVFRKTLSPIAGRIGSRQIQGWGI